MTLAETSSHVHHQSITHWFRATISGWFTGSVGRLVDHRDREPPVNFPEIAVVAQAFPGDPSAAMIAELWMIEEGRRRNAHAVAVP